MPSRVLEIVKKESGEYSVRLHESLSDTFSYVALRYADDPFPCHSRLQSCEACNLKGFAPLLLNMIKTSLNFFDHMIVICGTHLGPMNSQILW